MMTNDPICLIQYSSNDVSQISVIFEPVGTVANGPILLDNVLCNGDEIDIMDCGHNGVGEHNCVHDEDVAIRCVARPTYSKYIVTVDM